MASDTKVKIVIGLLVAYLAAWMYTEVAEHYETESWREQVQKFMQKSFRDED